MSPERRVFVDVDTQRDFLEPEGALYIHGADAVVPNLARLTAFASKHHIPVLATACAHTLDEPDPEPFPPHCLVGTRGQERVEATAPASTVVVGVEEHHEGPRPSHLTLQKRRYDIFSHPDAERIVRLFGADDSTFVVYGVATDYCVKAAVLGLLARKCKVAVVTDAIKAVDPVSTEAHLAEFAAKGAKLTTTDEVCRSS